MRFYKQLGRLKDMAIQAISIENKIRPFLLAIVALAIIIEIVALSPSSLEQPEAGDAVSPENLKAQEGPGLAKGIPKNKVPDYTIDQFQYVSSEGTVKQWKLVASRAYMYNEAKLVHAVNVTAYLYDTEDKITVVTGREAKYFMHEKDLEIFGDVKTRFPDGFETESAYMRYLPVIKSVTIPTSYPVKGRGDQHENSQILGFESMGMEFALGGSEVVLPKSANVVMTRKRPKDSTTLGVPDETRIKADRCVMDRSKQIAHFTMYPEKKDDLRFVNITQPSLFAKGRKADLNYGDYSELIQYLTAEEDVFIKETGDKVESLRYGTGGKAVFDTKRDVVVLTEFPQVYQNNDTVTGDVIILHRDTDIVEVEHSNAFSEGQTNEQSK